MTILGTIRALAEALAAYYTHCIHTETYDTLRHSRERRTKAEEELVRVATDGSLDPDVRDRLVKLLNHRLAELHEETRAAQRRFAETEDQSP